MTQPDNNSTEYLYTYPENEYKTHTPTPTGPITSTYQITDGTETITTDAQRILKEFAKPISLHHE